MIQIDVNKSIKNWITPLMVSFASAYLEIVEMVLAHPEVDTNG